MFVGDIIEYNKHFCQKQFQPLQEMGTAWADDKSQYAFGINFIMICEDGQSLNCYPKQ